MFFMNYFQIFDGMGNENLARDRKEWRIEPQTNDSFIAARCRDAPGRFSAWDFPGPFVPESYSFQTMGDPESANPSGLAFQFDLQFSHDGYMVGSEDGLPVPRALDFENFHRALVIDMVYVEYGEESRIGPGPL
jgi:hypothetical protein